MAPGGTPFSVLELLLVTAQLLPLLDSVRKVPPVTVKSRLPAKKNDGVGLIGSAADGIVTPELAASQSIELT